jgi:hypothetical protein
LVLIDAGPNINHNIINNNINNNMMNMFFFFFLSLSLSLYGSITSCEARLGGSTSTSTRSSSSENSPNMFGSTLVDHPTGEFMPLDCNANLVEEPCNTTWSSMFGNRSTYRETVVIPCGKCIVMDKQVYTQTQNQTDLRGSGTYRFLRFLKGLDIQGKFVVPDGTPIYIKTTYILVQGELHLESSKPINGNPAIHITFLHSNDPISFHPASNNTNTNTNTNSSVCGGPFHECDLGDRPFVVAGGKVNIRGLPSQEMPTWVPLLDIHASEWTVPPLEYQSYHAPPENCNGDGILMDHDFSQSSPPSPFIAGSDIGATLGSYSEWTGHSLKISQRRHAEHGPVVDMRDVQHCLQAGVTYLLTARIVVGAGEGVSYTRKAPAPTECAKSGKDCMAIVSKYMPSENNPTERKITKWSENQSHQTRYGTELKIAIEITFTEEEVRDSNAYHVLQIRGPSPGDDMELLEFSIRLPPPEAFPDPNHICDNLVPSNGDAELFPLSPFPFQTNSDNSHLIVVEEHSNRYFQVTGREFALNSHQAWIDDDWNEMGITWTVPHSCVKFKATYRIHANVRVHSEQPVVMEWNLRGHDVHKKPLYASMVTCPPSKGEWVTCDGEFTVSDYLVDHAVRYEVLVETMGTFTSNYDVDNLSFELTQAPVDRLILPKTIQHNWVAGAQLLITSHTTNWESRQVALISRVEEYGEHMLVQLNRSIERPVTVNENPYYATEVALLSRNILLEGGGHFTVLHTRNVPQTIQGADFESFGIEGVRDRYPIHFDDCHDSIGSIVSKNTIRKSKQRCVVLHATNHVLIEGNVAYDNAGHCFALEGGMEHGNVFEYNLGAYTRKVGTTMPQMGVSGKETDDTPATFWITNPLNKWSGNVATGSESYGFWVQLRKASRGPHASEALVKPDNTVLELFQDNVAHSVNRAAMKVTGYHPMSHQSFVGFRSYLNENGPLEISNSENLSLVNTILDKPLQEGSYAMELKNVTVVEHRGCNNATSSDEYTTPVSSNDDYRAKAIAAPSAPSVFNLEEMIS